MHTGRVMEIDDDDDCSVQVHKAPITLSGIVSVLMVRELELTSALGYTLIDGRSLSWRRSGLGESVVLLLCIKFHDSMSKVFTRSKTHTDASASLIVGIP